MTCAMTIFGPSMSHHKIQTQGSLAGPQMLSTQRTAVSIIVLSNSWPRQGSTMYSNYGNKSNEELILGYGFDLDDNVADFFHVSLGHATQNEGMVSCIRNLL